MNKKCEFHGNYVHEDFYNIFSFTQFVDFLKLIHYKSLYYRDREL